MVMELGCGTGRRCSWLSLSALRVVCPCRVLPSFDTAGLALQPREGVPLAPDRGFGSARRSASLWAASLPATNQWRNEVNINKYICTGRLTKDPELRESAVRDECLPAASRGRRHVPWP